MVDSEIGHVSAGQQMDGRKPAPLLPPQVALAQVMTYAETAKLANISKATLQRLVAKKLSPPVVVLSARRRGFRTGDVLAWLEARASSNGDRV